MKIKVPPLTQKQLEQFVTLLNMCREDYAEHNWRYNDADVRVALVGAVGPGKAVFHAYSSEGHLEHWSAQRHEDVQSFDASCDISGPISESSITDPQQVAADSRHPAHRRIEALHKIGQSQPAETVEFILNQLQQKDLPADWRDGLVFAIETIPIIDTQRSRSMNSLIDFARRLRLSDAPHLDEVVKSALRRGSSLMLPQDANLLVDFLDRKGYVDTRLTALKAVIRLFEKCPPSDNARISTLAERLSSFASKFLDPDVFEGELIGAIALASVQALAAIGDASLMDRVNDVVRLRRQWLLRQVRSRLTQLQAGWLKRDASVASSPAYQSLTYCLSQQLSAAPVAVDS